MVKRSIAILAVFTLVAACLSSVFARELFADCQVGAFIADWAKEATFPWHSEQGIVKYENIIQKKVTTAKIYSKIVDDFPFRDCLTLYHHGTANSPTYPYIDIAPKISDGSSQPILQNIIDGEYDSYIENWARQAKAFGKPLWICFDGEMNGAWGDNPGSGAANGGGTLNGYGDPAKPDGPERYVAAWRHIHDIFDSVGADNVAWVWAVNNEDWPNDGWNHFENYYPGDAYVDWLGVDGYNWNRAEYGGWETFQNVFESALLRLRAINAIKPIILAEFATANGTPGQKSAWITDCFNLLKTTYPYNEVRCFIWFDMNKEENWLIDSDGNQAVRTALADPYFTSNGGPGTSFISSSLPVYVKRFNCGGAAYTAANGEYYAADQGYTPENGAGAIGGVSASTTINIDGTVDDPLYQVARQGGEFQYRFDVANGWYKVKLQFAEIVHGDTRSFLVLINGAVVKNFFASSVSAAAGGMYKAYDLEFFTNVTNGQIIIEFSPAPGAPGWDVTGIINAISVVTAKPAGEGTVRASGRQILVNGQPFEIKGVCYQPIPIGYSINQYNIFTDPNIYNRDFTLLRQMNCNAIRTWGKVGYYDQYGSFFPSTGFMDAAYNGGINPIYVIMGFYVDGSLNLADPAVRQSVIDEFKLYVHLYRNHPAVLMWAIGNETNYWYSGDKKNWYTLVNELAWAAYEVEGASYHPVTTPNGDIWNSTGPIGSVDFKTDDNSMVYLDAWGANVYSGWDFQGRLQHYAALSSKPFWISEYGFPGTDERNQAEGARVLWEEIARNSNACSGGTIMEYSDEWWKSGSPDRHNDSDGVEFFGVVSAEDNGSAADIMHPKPAYYALQEAWMQSALRNIASGKAAYASSVEAGTSHVAANAVDRNSATRWSSVASDPQWIYIDLGETHPIGSIVLLWEAAYASAYEIQVSDDASNWTTVYSVSGGDGYNDFIYFDDVPVKGRYVRLYGAQRGTPWGYSLWEFEIYEPLPHNAAKGKTVFASSVEGGTNYPATNAVDGNFTTRWSSNSSADPQWIYTDLGNYYDISQVILRWEAAYATSYKIQKSMNGYNWYDVTEAVISDGTDDYIDFNPAFRARYVRIYCTNKVNPAWGYSLWEFEAIGKVAIPAEVPGDYSTIQEAINMAQPNGYIYVKEGIYEEDLTIPDQKYYLIIEGEGPALTSIKGNIAIINNRATLSGLSILYKEGSRLTYTDPYYNNLNLSADAGITAVNSDITVKNCIIKPDPALFGEARYGKGIQIWNMYDRGFIAPIVQNNLILNAETGLFLFSQVFGGEIWGVIENSTFYNNEYCIVERMHKENPIIRNNIITESQDGVHITYEDGLLLSARLVNVADNVFWNNINDVWCDETQEELAPLPDKITEQQGNLYLDPQLDANYLPQNPPTQGKGAHF